MVVIIFVCISVNKFVFSSGILHTNIRSHYSRLETPFFTLLFVDRTHTETCCHFSVGSSFYFVSTSVLSISATSVIEARRANILSIAT